MKTIIFNLTMLLFVSFAANAQKIKVKEGKLSSLSSITSYDVVFTYENMKVGKKQETTYLEEKVKAYNDKEAGNGDKFKENWFADRDENFEPKFISLFNDHSKGEVTIKEGDEANAYVMEIATIVTEPGFNVGVMRRNAYVTLKVTYKEKASNKVLAVIDVIAAPGAAAMGYDFDSGLRIQEAYAKAGKELGAYMRKKVF